MIYLIFIGIALLLSGFSEGIMDWLQFRLINLPNHKLYNNKFWFPPISCNNKWKNGDKSQGEKFFLSSTILVFLTDGWHLMKWCRNRFMDVVIFFMLIYMGIPWYTALSSIVVGRTLYHSGFYISYKRKTPKDFEI